MNESLISEFYSLGCPTESQARVTLQVYLELCEVKRYWDVAYHFDCKLKRMYLTAKKVRSESPSVFIPALVSEKLNFLKLQELLSVSKEYEQKSSDSTSVYYQLVEGLEKPSDTSAKHLRENKQEKLDAELRKNRALIEQSALFGLPITINQSASGSSKTNS